MGPKAVNLLDDDASGAGPCAAGEGLRRGWTEGLPGNPSPFSPTEPQALPQAGLVRVPVPAVGGRGLILGALALCVVVGGWDGFRGRRAPRALPPVAAPPVPRARAEQPSRVEDPAAPAGPAPAEASRVLRVRVRLREVEVALPSPPAQGAHAVVALPSAATPAAPAPACSSPVPQARPRVVEVRGQSTSQAASRVVPSVPDITEPMGPRSERGVRERDVQPPGELPPSVLEEVPSEALPAPLGVSRLRALPPSRRHAWPARR